MSFKNLVDLLQKSVTRFADRPIYGERSPSGAWTYRTYRDFGTEVAHFRGGLASLGVGPGDRVAVISNNRPAWAVGAYATYSLGACYVPMYEKQNPADWEYILNDSGAKVLLAANAEIAEVVRGLAGRVKTLESVIDLSAARTDPHSFKALMETGQANPVDAEDPDPDTLCGFIYTSGTTGKPKGVLLSHGNIISNVNAVISIFDMAATDRSLSFLPWAHSFGQTCELHCGLAIGASSAICDDVTKLVGYLSEVKPTLLFSVPRIFNRIYDGLNKKMAEASPVKQKLFQGAMANANKRRQLKAQGKTNILVECAHKVFDKLVFSKVRERLGGRLRYAFSGGAAISREVAEFIDNVGITVYEGYGLSETSPIATANAPGKQRIGSVGRPLPGVEIIIDTEAVDESMGDQGEVLIKGPNVMQGYHNLKKETKAAIRKDGAFRSGDLGRVDKDGYLYITGRIKEQYKLENGKYVVPAPLEEQLKLSGYINQVLVYGDNRLFNVAIIVPDVEALQDWAKKKGLPTALTGLLAREDVKGLYRAELAKFERDVFKGFERVKAFELISEEFSTDNDMLTPTLKLKRRNVIKAYKDTIEALYG